MDWINTLSWIREDAMFEQKRKVSNRGSQYRPHVIGSFHSHKMQRVVEYESLGEYLFYSLLELDTRTVRYYVQPVEVPIPHLDERGRPTHWNHVPDVLVYRQGSIPYLYQIKDPSNVLSKKDQLIQTGCQRYAQRFKWGYSIIIPKMIPKVNAINVKFLMGFLKPRSGYDTLLPRIISRMKVLQSTSILELSKGFQPEIHPLQVLPAIYHLIAKGIFAVNVNDEIERRLGEAF